MNDNFPKVYWKRKINKIQDSLYVCIPKEYTDSMHLQKGDSLKIATTEDGTLVMKAISED